MANSRTPGPLHPPTGIYRIPARTNGPTGLLDQSDPNVTALLGDTPGPLGFNDAKDPTLVAFGVVGPASMWIRRFALGVVQQSGNGLRSAHPAASAQKKAMPNARQYTLRTR